MSYSQIKRELKVSKSTLSLWLAEYPLSKDRIRELRDTSEKRIERCRQTKALKKETHLKEVQEEMNTRIGVFTERESFIGGLLLYWAEGTKATQDQCR